ncbi:hypothetical protein HPP92_004519 [Vanilla planifolia]|uniref:TLC domain-containing protein n=1 Tax=Vanilla planifolia TaxID=51239 RepID=A0A835VE18_VANPL|nr:hypothetical protein HPP92_004519 [Vanilla planifolia]
MCCVNNWSLVESLMQTLSVTFSYLIYDLICCQLDEQTSLDNTMHHLVSIVGIGAGLAYEQCGSEMVASLWITEISSPFLHLREILKELGYRDTNINLTFDILFAVTFSIARMVGGPHLLYATFMADNPILIKMMAMGLQLVSTFWFYKIMKMMRYKLTKRMNTQKSKKLNSEGFGFQKPLGPVSQLKVVCVCFVCSE